MAKEVMTGSRSSSRKDVSVSPRRGIYLCPCHC